MSLLHHLPDLVQRFFLDPKDEDIHNLIKLEVMRKNIQIDHTFKMFDEYLSKLMQSIIDQGNTEDNNPNLLHYAEVHANAIGILDRVYRDKSIYVELDKMHFKRNSISKEIIQSLISWDNTYHLRCDSIDITEPPNSTTILYDPGNYSISPCGITVYVNKIYLLPDPYENALWHSSMISFYLKSNPKKFYEESLSLFVRRMRKSFKILKNGDLQFR